MGVIASPHPLPPGSETCAASQAIDDLIAAALRHRAVRHPYLFALAEGTLPNPAGALADFARHYQGYSAHFPRFLTAVISRLEITAHREGLLANLREESGHYAPEELATLHAAGITADWIVGVPHPELFQRFRRAVAFARTESGRADLGRGMHKALALRDGVWSWLHERARRMAA